MTEKVKPKKKRKRRKRPNASITNTVTDVPISPASAKLNKPNGNARHSDVSPNKAQSNNHDSKPQTPVASPSMPPVHQDVTSPISPTAPHETSTSDSGSDSESDIDLLSCTNVSYEKRGDTHGVSYRDSANKCGWTPVVGRRKKKTPLPEYVLRRFPPHRRAELQRFSSDSESSGPDEPLDFPAKSSVEFAVHNSQPGLHVKTRGAMNWTPIASRTRARFKETQ